MVLLAGQYTLAQTGNQAALQPYEETIPGSTVKFNMMPVPAGSFTMGSAANEAIHKPEEGPARKVKLDAFWMGAREVTYDEFLLFFNDDNTSRDSEVDAVTRPTPQYIDLSWGMGKQGGFPVNSMSQYTAIMYCRWLYKKTGHFYRLPTEAEWEYAARGGRSQSPYPWGGPYLRNKKGCLLANFKPGRGNYVEDGGFYTVRADAYWPNDFGLYNMAGNVSEWTSSLFYESAYNFVHDMNPDIRWNALDSDPPRMKRKVVRGGSWKDVGYYLQTSTRQYEYQDTAKSYIGFRCVIDLPAQLRKK